MIDLPTYTKAIEEQKARFGKLKNAHCIRIIIYEKIEPYNDNYVIDELNIIERYFNEFKEDMKQYKQLHWASANTPILSNESFLG